MSQSSLPLRRRASGFSLIEMIGVLAIIAVLAAIIVPKVFSTIASSRITHAVGSINSMKSAVADFAARYGRIPTTNNNQRLDDLLVTAGSLDDKFILKIGTQRTSTAPASATWSRATGAWAATGGSNQTGQSRLINVAAAPTATPGAGTNYRLDGTLNLPAGSVVSSAVVVGLTAAEAHELSLRIDGNLLTEAAPGTADIRGRVTYAAPAGNATTYTAYVYLGHQ